MATAEKSWGELSAEEKMDRRFASWRSAEGVRFISAEAEAVFKARVDRLTTALRLRGTPDRVPVTINAGFYPASYAGLTPYDALTDTERACKAWVDFNREFQPDVMVDPMLYTQPAAAFEALDYRLYQWPGHGVPNEAGFQYNEAEYMLPEEYDDLIEDPTDYMLRTYLPRTVGAFEGFADLSSPFDFVEYAFVGAHVLGYSAPSMVAGIERLGAAGREMAAWSAKVLPVLGQLTAEGFPGMAGGFSKAPFDFIGDSLRGTRGMVFDMYRMPDKVIAACERLAPLMVKWVTSRARRGPAPGIVIPLHKGADGFMSDEQYRTFYWPSLRTVILGLIDAGFMPILFAEGSYNSRLEVIKDLPRGKTTWLFDQTDMVRAKEVLGDVACIRGNVPLSLIHAGTPEAVADYCKRLIDTAGRGGGFILDIGAVADSGNDENLHAMMRTGKEYGVYS